MRKPIPKSVRKQVYQKCNGHCAWDCGFSDGLKAACLLILESLKDQRFEIIDSKKENCAIALDTIDKSIKSVEDRLNYYNSRRPLN